MNTRFITAVLLLTLFSANAGSEEVPSGLKGFYLLTDYPASTVRPGSTSSVGLRLHNYALPPERLSLAVSGIPDGWTVTLLGGGQPVAAAMPATNSSVALDLRLDLPN